MSHQQGRLDSILRERIQAAGGWISFNHFMQSALYEPGLGYYETADVFGETGDFVTAPELGPWLAIGLADLVSWGWDRLGQPSQWCLIEQGGGSGRLICAVLEALQHHDKPLPGRIIAVEASERLRLVQRQAYDQAGVDVACVSSLSELDQQENCLMFCNELPDAFPVRCFVWLDEQMVERGVAVNEEGFAWSLAEQALTDAPEIADDIRSMWPDGYVSEWNPHLMDWQRDLSSVMQRGYVFCVDYGFPQQEYYRPQRLEGTLMAHYRHQASDDVFSDPGSRDITAHVDFTALAGAANKAGLEAVCFMPQGAWLAQSPLIQQSIVGLAASSSAENVQALSHAKRMMLPVGMGELFKLIILSCDMPAGTPDYLCSLDRLQAIKL